MRRTLTLAAFLLTISIVPVCAQRGGHGSSGGSHGAFSGGGHASFGGSHGSFGGHAGLVGHGYGGSGLGSHIGSLGTRSFARGNHFRGSPGYFGRGRFGAYGYGNGCYGYGCWGYGYPLYAYGGIDPYWWWDSDSSDQDDADQRAMANDMNQENLDEQQQLRQQDQDAYARPMNRPQNQARTTPQANTDLPTVLVYRDQHRREIQNYAIVGSTLWAFTPQRTERIPLADLDIPATTKANEDRGVDFRLPRSNEGQ